MTVPKYIYWIKQENVRLGIFHNLFFFEIASLSSLGLFYTILALLFMIHCNLNYSPPDVTKIVKMDGS